MRRFSSILCVLGLVLLVPPLAAQDAETQRKEDLARELMEVTQAGDMGEQVIQYLVRQFRASSPDVPEAFWERFRAGVDVSELEEMVVPIYVRHLTVEEMEAAVEFYRTPEGQGLIRKMPLVMQESMAAGQKFSQEVAQKLQQDLEAHEPDEAVEKKDEEPGAP